MPNAGYQEIAGRLRDRITNKEWHAGAALPSEAQLSAEWGVTRTTIRRALEVLEADELVEVIPGRGRFVRSAPGDLPREPSTRLEQVAATLRSEISSGELNGRLASEAKLAERFGVAQGTARQALQRLEEDGVVTAVHGRGWFVSKAGGEHTQAAMVANKIRQEIASGNLPEDSDLPGEMALATEHGVSRVTIRRALADLEDEGLLIKKQGRGRTIARNQINKGE